MQIIPLQAVPAQIVNVVLSGQVCQFVLQQKFYGMFCDIYVNNTLIVGGVICQNRNRIKRYGYLDFVGDVFFIDTQGELDPYYTGIGTDGRYKFCYVDAVELATILEPAE